MVVFFHPKLTVLKSNSRPSKSTIEALSDLEIFLSKKTIYTPEGKALQSAYISNLNTITTELTNFYNGKTLNYNNILDASMNTLKALNLFVTALEELNI